MWSWRKVGLISVFVLVLAGCGGEAEEPATADNETEEAAVNPEDRLATIIERDRLIVGVNYHAPPLGFLNPETSEPEGYEIEIGKLLAEEILGDASKVEFVEAGSDTRIPMVQQGDIDLIVASMSWNEERAEQVAYSLSYNPSGIAVAVPPGSEIQKPEDMAGHLLCQPVGSFAHGLLQDVFAEDYGIEDPEIGLVEFPTYPECVQAVRTGRADFIATMRATLVALSEETGGQIEVLPGTIANFPDYIGMELGNPELEEAVNNAILAIFEDGRLAEAFERTQQEELPEDWVPGPPSDVFEEAG